MTELEPSAEDRARTVQVLVAELSALRAEMTARITAQQQLFIGAATVSAVVLGFVVSEKADARTLFVIPFVTVALGFAHNDHARYIGYFGLYIGQVLTPALRDATQSSSLPTWEDVGNDILFGSTAVRRNEQILSASFYTLLYFLLPSGTLIALAARGDVEGFWYWAIWAAGLSATIALLALSIWVGVRVYGASLGELRQARPPRD